MTEQKKPITIKIDETEYTFPKMKFKTLKQAFKLVMSVQGEEDPMVLADAAIAVVSMALVKKHPTLTPEWIEENLNADETNQLTPIMMNLMVDAGLMTRAEGASLMGEAAGEQLAPPSTEISTPSSPNWSQQDVPAETGTS